MVNPGYLMLGGKVLFDDPYALALRGSGAGAPAGRGLRTRRMAARRAVDLSSRKSNATGETADAEPDLPPLKKLFVARTRNRRYTGEICGVWFSDGEALCAKEEAEALLEAGCEVTVCGGTDDFE
ncbi:MAG: hypothetical protein HRF49_01405 [bacterium]|jgi:hypothetical protein